VDAESDRDAERVAYRRFVRTHHPDVGGDPDVFMAGLAEFRQHDTEPFGHGAEQFRQHGMEPADPDPDDRFSGPVVFVTRPRGWRRMIGALRGARRRRPPRVH
jgi:hypothetical protein